ncbi:MAG: FtsK/SpoIIIE domain-containing protein [Planctomycetota bacterium]|nr:FtsK/SpoIIIE domain-containing protein [Planctomycetota bacterium]MDA1211101.1 FtsK/SpoIIIE domain-containing protein [Planctomycetota bacterium]
MTSNLHPKSTDSAATKSNNSPTSAPSLPSTVSNPLADTADAEPKTGGAQYALASYQHMVTALQHAIAERSAAEQTWETWQHEEQRQIHQDHQLQTSRLDERREHILQVLRDESTRNRQAIRTHLEPEIRRAQEQQASAKEEIQHRWEADMQAAQALHDETCWMVQSYFDESSDNSPQSQLQTWEIRQTSRRDDLARQSRELETLETQTEELLKSRRLRVDVVPSATEPMPVSEEQSYQRFVAASNDAQAAGKALQAQRMGKLFVGLRPLGLWVTMSLPIMVLLFLMRQLLGFPGDVPMSHWQWYALGGGLLLGWIGIWILHSIALSHAENVMVVLKQSIFDCERAFQAWQKHSQSELEKQRRDVRSWYEALVQKRDSALQKARETLSTKQREVTNIRDAGLEQVVVDFPDKIAALQKQLQDELDRCETEYRGQVHQAQAEAQSAKTQIERAHHDRVAAHRQQAQERWEMLSHRWEKAIHYFQGTVEHLHRELAVPSRRRAEQLPATVGESLLLPEAIRVGEYRLDVSEWDDATPRDPRLSSLPLQYILPAAIPLLDVSSLVLMFRGQGRRESLKILQLALYRWLTAFPPGQLRSTIIDPVGLGENFSAFMHLKDYDDALISGRILTEEQAIDQRLMHISEQIEHILQSYLRNEFATLAEYNRAAGEVAEPYHLLVIADFPTNFSEESARRLLNIMRTGPRCGIWTVIGINNEAQLPQAFENVDLEKMATVWKWKQGGFHPGLAGLEKLVVASDELPPHDELSRSLRQFGELARAAKRVEVSFSRIAPTPDRMWSSDSAHGIHIPLGRSGPSQWQQLKLGGGTSQHVVIAGKTGSGKSSFLHALITNVALHYSPDQIELYLIDFKKGVEFKTYASHALPHARVIAIESDREFGISVLERLDRLLQERGEKFRQAGVQDLASYRQAHPEVKLPRVMLIVDEFQEFFVEDDRYSQAASLFLDRLVRQGRAFGIHVLLGSQTLGGAYTLARSTLGQMHVRIALQCSEADAHLILSEENTAARRLTRPGEAIYNDANGLVEGNHNFQIAWLSETQREQYLQKIKDRADECGIMTAPALVFEGHRPADPMLNSEIVTLWNRLTHADAMTKHEAEFSEEFEPSIWLGEAVSLTSPPSVTLKRQNGCHLLLVGQQPTAAAGMMAVASASLLAEVSPTDGPADPSSEESSARTVPVVSILDGSAAQSDEHTLWRRFSSVMKAYRPDDVAVYGPSDAADVLENYMRELERREERADQEFSTRVLIVFDVARFRTLRKSDDDFGFGRHDAEKRLSSSQQFAEILKRGPSVGLHLLVWCDTNSNAMRWLGMQLLREFEMRILFPMSSADSSQLIDTPEAGRLGVHRALLHRSDLGTVEKFRPFGELSDNWWRIWQPVDLPVNATEPTDIVADTNAPAVEEPISGLPDDRAAPESVEKELNLDICDDIDQWPVT